MRWRMSAFEGKADATGESERIRGDGDAERILITVTWRSAVAPDAARGALAFGAELRRLSLPLGLHAPIDRLHVGFGEVDALDADVDDLHAKLARFLVDLACDRAHQTFALVAHHVGEARAAQHAPKRGLENGAKRSARRARFGRTARDR